MNFEDSMSRIVIFEYSKNILIFLHKMLLFEKCKTYKWYVYLMLKMESN
jgi:hypothetical protein